MEELNPKLTPEKKFVEYIFHPSPDMARQDIGSVLGDADNLIMKPNLNISQEMSLRRSILKEDSTMCRCSWHDLLRGEI